VRSEGSDDDECEDVLSSGMLHHVANVSEEHIASIIRLMSDGGRSTSEISVNIYLTTWCNISQHSHIDYVISHTQSKAAVSFQMGINISGTVNIHETPFVASTGKLQFLIIRLQMNTEISE
jgi:hypothetical protein